MGGRNIELLLILACVFHGSLCDHQCPDLCFCDDKNEYVTCEGDGQKGGFPDLPNSSTRLELKNFDLRVLTASILDGLEALKELKLQEMNLEFIEDSAFIKLNGLSKLDLSWNLIMNLTGETLQGLNSLRFFDISSNHLRHVEEAFVNLSKVEQLNLATNQLRKLTALTFYGLSNIRYLNLNGNKIASIKVDTFQNHRNLAHLILSNNPLVTLSRLNIESPRLQYMDLSHGSLENVPTHTSKFVKDFRLAKNKITTIRKDDFVNYPFMELLVLDDNMIADIEDGTWEKHQYLLKMWINGNKLSRIPSSLPSSMRSLFMEENIVVDISNYSFRGLINLEKLYLQRNKIKTISTCGFCGLRSLKVLDVQANFIETIPEGAFSNLVGLETLDLSQNTIKNMNGESFVGLKSLLRLQISRMNTDISFNEDLFDRLNNLQTLGMYDSSKIANQALNSSHALSRLRNLKILNIMRNDLTNLREDFASFFPKLTELKIGENRWHCDRSILWLSRWIRSSKNLFPGAQALVCSTPPELEDIPILTLTEEYFGMMSSPTSLTTYAETKSHLNSTLKSVEGFTTRFSIDDRKHTLQGKTNSYPVMHPDEALPSHTQYASGSTETTLTFWEYQFLKPVVTSPTRNTSEPSSANRVSKIILTEEGKKDIDIMLISCLASVCVIILIGILIGLVIYRRSKKHQGNTSSTSVSSSIAYCPCRDEVLTAFDTRTDTDHGVGNKLYYIIDNA